MVASTITTSSGIVKDNIMTHIGNAQLELNSIAKGSGYHLNSVGIFFLLVSLAFFVWDYNKTKRGPEVTQNQDYRLLMTEHP